MLRLKKWRSSQNKRGPPLYWAIFQKRNRKPPGIMQNNDLHCTRNIKDGKNLPLSSAQPTSCLQKTIDLRSHELPNTSNAVGKCFSKVWIKVMSHQNDFCALELRPPKTLLFCFLSSAWKTKEYFVSSSSCWGHFTFSSLLALHLGNKT